MREIEFKAKRVDDGVWVYGSYTAMREDDHNECFRTKPHKIYHRIWQWESGDWNMGGYANYEVIPETVCQWTGLLDKQGVKIFEGDIVIFGKLFTVIKYFEKYGMFGLVGKSKYRKHDENEPMGSGGSSTGYKPYVLSEYYQRRMEVIGNIHDKHQQKQALIDMMRGDEKIGLYDDNPKNHGYER